jgi:hypothetical protein
MERQMKRISPERKASVLAKLLPPYNMTVTAVAQMEGIRPAPANRLSVEEEQQIRAVCHHPG